MSLPVTVRTRQDRDLPAIVELMQKVYPLDRFGPGAVWRVENLRSHLEVFPEGQHVALTPDGQLVATSTTLLTTRERALAPHTWSEITERGTLASHLPNGDTLYGVNIAVDPDLQGRGVGRALYEARIVLARSKGCQAFAAGARIPGYGQHAGYLSPEAYLEEVVAGRLYDPTLSKQIRIGFRVMGLLPDYAADPETCNHAALILMELA